MRWKSWKTYLASAGILLAIIVGPFVDFFERIPVIRTILYPFFYFSFKIIGKPFAYFLNQGYNRTAVFIPFYIVNIIIYAAIGFTIGLLIEKYLIKSNASGTIKGNINKGVVKQLQQKIKKDEQLVKKAEQKIKQDTRLVKQMQRKVK